MARKSTTEIPIIDSHIHLYPASELHTLSWNTPSHELWGPHTVNEYLTSVHTRDRIQGTQSTTDSNNTSSYNDDESDTTDSHTPAAIKPQLKGFIFIETDRKTHATDSTIWETGPLLELQYLISLSRDKHPVSSAERGLSPSNLLLGIVPWAPLLSGFEVLDNYISRCREIAGEKWGLVKGFRYLLQDKPRGTMDDARFVAGVRRLGEMGFVFDLGIDFRCGGAWQVDDAVALLESVGMDVEHGQKVRIVVNHMCKPAMSDGGSKEDDERLFQQWKTGIQRVASFENTFVKISGGFSEMEPLPKLGSLPEDERLLALEKAKKRIWRFIDVTADAFGSDRIMFGSDWPVCNVGGGGAKVAWNGWLGLVREWAETRELSTEDQERLFWKNAHRAYNVAM